MKQRTAAQVEHLPCVYTDVDGVVYREKDKKKQQLLINAYDDASYFMDTIFNDNKRIKSNV